MNQDKLAPEEIFTLLDRTAANLPDDPVLVEDWIGRFTEYGLLDSPQLLQRLDGGTWDASAFGRRLIAKIQEERRQWADAIVRWTRVIDAAPGIDHEALLARARARAQTGDNPGAFSDLRAAVPGNDDFAFLTRAAKLYRRLRQKAAPPSLRQAKVALLSSTTTALAAPLLELACFRDGIDATLYEAPYDSYRQQIIDPQSELYRFQPDVVLIATHWRDANLPAFSDDPEATVADVVEPLRQLWKTLLERLPCRVVQHSFDQPRERSFGHLSHSLPGGRAAMLREVNRQLLASAPPAVAILDLEQAAARSGAKWTDDAFWHLAKQHPASGALPVLVDHQVALIRAQLGLTKKVLVFDLDNTLWGGVIGEDGLEEIVVGPPSPAGEAYQALQRYAKELKSRGVLLAVCSKNNEADAKLPFEKHDAMILHLDDFALFRANWDDKPSNLRAMAELLQLSLDSFVLLDDNPTERAFVRRELPDVAVPEIGADPATFVEALDRMMYFESITLSEEDRQRHRQYQENAARRQVQQQAGSLDEFLRHLQMEAELGPVNESVLARIVQLLGKTNQFNLTTLRHGESKVREMIASPKWWTHYFKLRDRFGDNGLVGLIIAHETDAATATWEIDTWLMSCRVIGRKMEELMLSTLAHAAKERGIRRLRGVYIPTPKNGMVADLYPRLGFKANGDAAGAQIFEFDLETQQAPACDCIQVLRPAEA
jgi:FkbH-like protein